MNSKDMFAKISILKNKIYCNTCEIIYYHDTKNVPKINTKINAEIVVINEPRELERYMHDDLLRPVKTKLRYFLEKGCTLYLQLVAGVPASYCIVTNLEKFRPYAYNSLPIFSGKNKYFIFFCHTRKDFRGKGLYANILSYICSHLRNDSTTVIISTDVKNIASQRGIEKAGFKKKYIIRYLRIGPIKYSKMTEP